MLFVVKSGCRDFASYLFRNCFVFTRLRSCEFTVYRFSYSLAFEISWFRDVVMSRFRGLSICSFGLCRFGKCMIRRFGDFTALRFDIIVICRFGYFTPFWICDSRFTYFRVFATWHFPYSWNRNFSEFDVCDFTCLLLSDFAFLWSCEPSFWQHCDFVILLFSGLELQAWCIGPCESVLHDKRIVIVKWNRPINVGRVAWTRKLHSPSPLRLELWQHW